MTNEGGTKFDSGKPRISLIPTVAIFEMAKALTYGANKYGEFNYAKGISYSRLIDATLRHLLAYKDGEDEDEESGVIHIGNAMANLAMLMFMHTFRKDLDDRFKVEENESPASSSNT